MAPGISYTLLSDISEFVAAKMGLHFPKGRLTDLAKGLGHAAKEFGFDDEEACARWLVSFALTREQAEVLASHLTVGETYFLRDKKTFEILEWEILPQLIESRRERGRYLRVWSAGCATGEEPYSMAMLLSKIIPDLQSWNISILATDINPHFLNKASKGVYGEWSFRDTPAWIRGRYFRNMTKGRFEILPPVKGMVSFAYLNLAEDAYPLLLNNTNAMDIILCRNVLMYFTPDMQRKVIKNLYRCLVDGGWLMVSPSEISSDLFAQFAAVKFSGMTFYRKETKECSIKGSFSLKYQQSQEIPDPLLHPPEHVRAPAHETGLDEESVRLFAVEAEEKGISKFPPDLYEEALAFYERGCYEEAASRIEGLLSENQNDSKAMALLAMVYANRGMLSDAVEWSEKAVVSDKMNPDRHYLLATILQEQGEIEGAVKSLKQSLYLNQDFVMAHFTLGKLMRQLGRIRESDKYFRNALSLLGRRQREEILAASEGLTAGRLIEIINSTSSRSDRNGTDVV